MYNFKKRVGLAIGTANPNDEDIQNTATGLGGLILRSDLYNKALAGANNNKLENFDSFVVTNPDLVDEGIDISGLRTTTDTSPYLLGNIPDYGGIQYEAYNPNRLSDLMRLYSGGFPMLDTPQAAPDFTGGEMIDTGGGGATLPGFTDSTPEPFQDLVDPNVNIDEFATEDTTMPSMLSPDMGASMVTDTTPINMSPLTSEQFVDTTSGLDDVDMNLIDQPFADTPVVLGSGNNALGLQDPQSLAIGPSGAVDFDTGGLEDYTTLTSAQAPVEQAPPGIMNPYDPSQSTILGQPGIDRFDEGEAGIDLDPSAGIEDIPVELPATNIETEFEPQAVNTILGPDGITYDAVTGNPIYEDLDAQAAATTLELNQIQDQPLRDKLSSSLTSATEGLSSVAELTGDKLREIGTSIAAAVGGVFKPDGSTITVPGLGEINVKQTIGGMILNKVVGGPISLVFDALGAIGGMLPKDSLENSTTRSIAAKLTAENNYGYNMQSGNIGQDPFGRNPVSAFGDYEQTLAEDAVSTSTTKMGLAKKQYAEDYFNAKAEVAGGVGMEDETVLGPGEAPGDLVSLEDQLAEQAAAEQAQAAKIEAERRELQEINAAAAREQAAAEQRARDETDARMAAEAASRAAAAAAAAREAARNQGGGNNGGGGQNTGGARGGGTSATSSGLGGLGFSDIRLKDNVELIGKSPSNINIYKFNYKGDSAVYEGVIANEVPWASVKTSNGYLMVDYNKIDVEFKPYAK